MVIIVKLLVFGNPALEIDNLAVKVGKELEKEGREVLHLENPMGLLDMDLNEYVILVVAVGINEVKLIDNVDKLVLGRLCSLHDMDMAYFLKLLKALGKLDTVRIIALPQGAQLEESLAAARELLHKL